jgi:hypothetical protein
LPKNGGSAQAASSASDSNNTANNTSNNNANGASQSTSTGGSAKSGQDATLIAANQLEASIQTAQAELIQLMLASGQSTAAQQRDAGQGMTLEQRLESQGAVPSSGQGYGFGQATQGQAPLVRSGAS